MRHCAPGPAGCGRPGHGAVGSALPTRPASTRVTFAIHCARTPSPRRAPRAQSPAGMDFLPGGGSVRAAPGVSRVPTRTPVPVNHQLPGGSGSADSSAVTGPKFDPQIADHGPGTRGRGHCPDPAVDHVRGQVPAHPRPLGVILGAMLMPSTTAVPASARRPRVRPSSPPAVQHRIPPAGSTGHRRCRRCGSSR